MNELSQKLFDAIEKADAVVIGAGSGLSTSAGFTYSGERFVKYFADFAEKYGFSDMYSGGFYPYATPEEHWAYWSRYIMINRYADAPKPVYQNLLNLVKSKDYFVLTTNVDHCFQKAGFDKERLFYTQGDYGLFQCSKPCHQSTYDNEKQVRQMFYAQGFSDKMEHVADICPSMKIPTELVPKCPICGRPMSMNLRADSTFVQDEGWYRASKRYRDFLESRGAVHDGRVLFLELGVGGNTPGIIKYPFWQMTFANPNATYVCVNYNQAYAPDEICSRSFCINGDIGEVLLYRKRDGGVAVAENLL